ncbi:MATE family efflux transporter [Bacillus sp. es.036]|uniref:MATE family efflux transporter n=1 Tax=Bacillus sp. es.036 TaxID=1761764 RepID=UPI000BF3A007|nr:MATE family efflux transporter [Bacillus sp. es.036]PFG12320.1 MATE family multidrug resistance protein [Bacillus sp. es.036]
MDRIAPSLEVKKACSHKEYLRLAIPLVISGISTPLLGAVDTAVVGRMPNPISIGGVAIGAVIFNTMYWLLGFLRVSTSGFTSQAEGLKDQKEILLTFFRPMIIAILFGLLFLFLQAPILHISLMLIGGSEDVSDIAASYFTIRIWGAPFILLSYVMIGWLIGMGKVRLALATQVVMNVLNILLDFIFVLGLEMGVTGVAYATLISEVTAVMFGAVVIYRSIKPSLKEIRLRMLTELEPLQKMFKVNRDLFLRTICLLAMTIVFTSKGASMGEVILAGNAILLQIHYMMAYLFGGFANASSILVGRSIGSKNRLLYTRAFHLSALWGLGSAAFLSLVMVLWGQETVSLFTTIGAVRAAAQDQLIWIVLFPILGFWGLQLEGIYSGATQAAPVRDSILLALLLFLPAIWLTVPILGNSGIWLSFILFSFGRSLFLSLYIPKVGRRSFKHEGTGSMSRSLMSMKT